MTRGHTVHLSNDRLIDLAMNLLAAADTAVTLGEIAECPECEERFRRLCRDKAILDSRSGESVHATFGGTAAAADQATAPARGSRLLVFGLAVAASVLFIVGVPLWLRSDDDPRRYWLPESFEPARPRLGVPGTADAHVDEALEAYRQRDAARVVALLGDSDAALIQRRDSLALYLASALAHEGRGPEADRLLDLIDVATMPLPYRDCALWIQAAARLDAGDLDGAKRILAELAAGDGDFSQRARRRIEKLR